MQIHTIGSWPWRQEQIVFFWKSEDFENISKVIMQLKDNETN